MGASGWTYKIPYQPDVSKALRELQDAVFADGDYYGAPLDGDADRSSLDDDPDDDDLDDAPPRTIEELLNRQAGTGTHSVIDMADGVSDLAEQYTVSPLTLSQLRAAFGTTRPAPAAVEAWMADGEYASPCSGWSGVFVVSYVDDRPTWLHVAGCSGD